MSVFRWLGLVLRSITLIALLTFCGNRTEAGDNVRWEPFMLKNGHIQFPILLNGISTRAMLDSGAEMNSISEYFVEKHREQLRFGDKIRLQGVFGTEEKRLVREVQATLFGAELPLKNLVPALLGGPDLLLGTSFMNNFVLQIDYPNQRLRLLKHEWVDMDKVANVELKRQKGSHLPAVKVQFDDDDSIWLTLDTGNSGGLFLPRSVAERRGWLEHHDMESGFGVGATGMAEIESFQLKRLTVGPFELENIRVTVPAEGERTTVGQRENRHSLGNRIGSGAQSLGLLGYDVLKHFVVTLDHKNLKLHLGLPESLPKQADAKAEAN